MAAQPVFDSLLVSVTEGCRVGCKHCGFIGSSRDRETDGDDLVEWVAQACAYGIAKIIFTGGEPFERFDVLVRGVRAAHAASAEASMFTSSYWATSVDEAKRLLSQLTGTTRLYLSTDVYHQRRIPFDYVRNAAQAAIELDIPTISLMITYATEVDRVQVAKEYEQFGDRVEIFADRVIPNPKFSVRTLAGQDPLAGFNPDSYKSSCWLATPILNPNGDLFACHAGKAGAHGDLHHLPYYLGNLRDETFSEVMIGARQRADYQFLRTHGPQGVAEMVQETPSVASACARKSFTNGCDMCFSVLSTPAGAAALREHAHANKEIIDLRLALLLNEKPVFDLTACE